MSFLKVICLFLVIECVFADEGSILKPCPVEDIECLSKATEMFLENTSSGIPAYDIRPIDPLLIPEIDVTFERVKFNFKNINITGFKKQKISDFKLDKAAGSVLLSTKMDLQIVSDVTIEFTSQSKSFQGTSVIRAEALTTARYDYTLKTDDKGVEHFDVGPETLTCDAKIANITLNPELNEILQHEAAENKKMDEQMDVVPIRKNIACKLIEKGYETVVHNIRASAKVLPKTAFFTNV